MASIASKKSWSRVGHCSVDEAGSARHRLTSLRRERHDVIGRFEHRPVVADRSSPRITFARVAFQRIGDDMGVGAIERGGSRDPATDAAIGERLRQRSLAQMPRSDCNDRRAGDRVGTNR